MHREKEGKEGSYERKIGTDKRRGAKTDRVNRCGRSAGIGEAQWDPRQLSRQKGRADDSSEGNEGCGGRGAPQGGPDGERGPQRDWGGPGAGHGKDEGGGSGGKAEGGDHRRDPSGQKKQCGTPPSQYDCAGGDGENLYRDGLWGGGRTWGRIRLL